MWPLRPRHVTALISAFGSVSRQVKGEVQCVRAMGDLTFKRGDAAASIKCLEEALSIAKRAVITRPRCPVTRSGRSAQPMCYAQTPALKPLLSVFCRRVRDGGSYRSRDGPPSSRPQGLATEEGACLVSIAEMHHAQGDFTQAKAHFERVCKISKEQLDPIGEAHGLWGLACARLALGETYRCVCVLPRSGFGTVYLVPLLGTAYLVPLLGTVYLAHTSLNQQALCVAIVCFGAIPSGRGSRQLMCIPAFCAARKPPCCLCVSL